MCVQDDKKALEDKIYQNLNSGFKQESTSYTTDNIAQDI